MKVRIAYTISVDDDYRRAIRLWRDRDGLATRAEVQQWMERYGSYLDEDIMNKLADHDEHGQTRTFTTADAREFLEMTEH